MPTRTRWRQRSPMPRQTASRSIRVGRTYSTTRLPPQRWRSRTSRARPWRRSPLVCVPGRSSRRDTFRPTTRRFPASGICAASHATAGLRIITKRRESRALRAVSITPVTTFSVRFLGCKVSHTDAQDVRERLLADGHVELAGGAEIAVVNTCCVTHEAVSKSRKEAARAARTHARVYVTGCGANLAANAFRGLPANVVVVAKRSEETPEFVAGDVGAIGCVQADARLDRVRAFVKVQDGCSFSCHF